jgi:[ribosomal protein S5]-alanine N-acetyltransferase
MIIRLETNRLLLRPPALVDVGSLVMLLNNFNVTRMTGRIPYPYSASDATDFVENCQQSADRWRLVILDKVTNTLLGGVGVRCEELGYWIAESDWGKGFASEAASAVVSDVFLRGKQKQITARWRTDNPASGRVLDKLNFVRVGTEMCTSQASGESLTIVETVLRKKSWLESQQKGPLAGAF